MQQQIVAAIFDSSERAEHAVGELRSAGVADKAISVVALSDQDGKLESHDGHGNATHQHHDNKSTGVMKGVAAGGAVGAFAGLAALAIPGVGPFIAAGAIGEALGAVGSAVVTSAAVGATAGGLTGGLVDYGISREEAEHFEKRVREGAALVTVDTRGSERDYNAVRAVLRAAGGETAESRVAAAT